MSRFARTSRRVGMGAILLSLPALCGSLPLAAVDRDAEARHPVFHTAAACLACHNGLTTASGEDVSIGSAWRGSMMANAALDPYWQASVRRETLEHATAADGIEDTCATCHMPMVRAAAAAAHQKTGVFAHLAAPHRRPDDQLAQDGVSCTVCHQIADRNLGTPDSFNGAFIVDDAHGVERSSSSPPSMLGPYTIDTGRSTVMESASGYRPAEAMHLRRSELCATCHTLFTQAIDARGRVVGRLPEQTPFLEWQHSTFRDEQSCQTCHMPPVPEPTALTSVLGTPRDGFARHTFRGGNFFVLGMLNRHRAELGVVAAASDLDSARSQTLHQLEADTASVAIEPATHTADRLDVAVDVENRTGHKFPTGFPSRRAWIHFVVRDAGGRVVFESGAIGRDGRIEGDDNDADARRYEPHVDVVRSPDEVQVYESIIGDVDGNVTTGLLNGVRYLKDNRLLPRGFAKATAAAEIAVVGSASDDADFIGGRDRVRYSVAVPAGDGPYAVEVELRFQPVGYRWARNLAAYESAETRRFLRFYDDMAVASSTVVARATTIVR